MPRVLIIRHEGYPFMIRMSKVIATILAAGWDCDILIPEGQRGFNVSQEMGQDVSPFVRVLEYPPDRSFRAKMVELRHGKHGVVHDHALLMALHSQLAEVQYDLIWVKDSPTLPLVFQCLDTLSRTDLPVVCDMYENAPAQVYDQYIQFGNPGSRLLHALRHTRERVIAAEQAFLLRCAHIFVVIEEMRTHLLAAYGLSPARVSVVHNVEMLALFDAVTAETAPVPDNMLCTYIGGFQPFRGLSMLLEAVTLLARQAPPSFTLALIGASRRKKRAYEQLCARRQIENCVQLVEYCSHAAVIAWFKHSRIGIIPHLDTEQIRTTIPNKLFQYMAAGVGCLVADVGPLGRIARETGCAVTFAADNPANLAEKLGEAIAHPEIMRECGKRGRQAVETHYCWEIQGAAYARYLHACAGIPAMPTNEENHRW